MGDDASGADEGKKRRSYFLQACMMVFVGLLILGAWGGEYQLEDLLTNCKDAPDSFKNYCNGMALMVATGFFVALGAGLAVLLYCCKDKVPSFLHWIISVILVLGGLLGCAGTVLLSDIYVFGFGFIELDAPGQLYTMAWMWYLFLLTIVVALSISSPCLADENQGKAELKRVCAQCIALIFFGLFVMPYYGDLGLEIIENMDDGQKAELAAAVFCFLFGIVVIICFCVCKEGTEEGGPSRVIRLVLAALIVFAGVCYFGARAKITDVTSPSSITGADVETAKNVQLLTPGIAVLGGCIMLGVEIAF